MNEFETWMQDTYGASIEQIEAVNGQDTVTRMRTAFQAGHETGRQSGWSKGYRDGQGNGTAEELQAAAVQDTARDIFVATGQLVTGPVRRHLHQLYARAFREGRNHWRELVRRAGTRPEDELSQDDRDRIILGWLSGSGVEIATLNDKPFAGNLSIPGLREAITRLRSTGPAPASVPTRAELIAFARSVADAMPGENEGAAELGDDLAWLAEDALRLLGELS